MSIELSDFEQWHLDTNPSNLMDIISKARKTKTNILERLVKQKKIYYQKDGIIKEKPISPYALYYVININF